MKTPSALFRLLPALLFGLLANTAFANANFQERCESQLPKIAVDLDIQVSDYTVDQSVPSKVLSKMSKSAYPGDQMLGMTSISSSIEFGVDGPGLQDQNSDLECIAPRIQVSLRYTPMRVYIAREFVRGTCPFREVLGHEMRHVKAYQEHLPKVEALVRNALQKRFANGVIYGTAGKTYDVLKKEVDGEWVPYIKTELRKVESKNEAIDSFEETFRISQACNGDIAFILINAL